ncbi:hypothetical protein HD806DRAFT_517577 [Xylariaceae sp. AK1471]|nr:hypothetical protein HD806DRAFT_517577 [Xylariaceae sp. AK1471]
MPRHNGTRASLIPTSSPLSSLGTTDSFATATASPDNIQEETAITDNSSIIAADDRPNPDALPGYYKAKGLPPELKEHCRVYLEEALPRQAIFLLDNLLSTRSSNHQEPAYCPPPSQISLLCSIIIHPDYTTRPKEPDWPQISLQSLVYLRDLLTVFGPINAGFKESVLFNVNGTSELDLDSQDAHNSNQDADERGLVRLSPRHGHDSVWQRGRDFFSVVGWALNCNFLYPERWQWWNRWVEFILDVLENDLDERYRLDIENGCPDMPLLRSSILASYITQRSGRTADRIMWIMKALFADGTTSATSVFPEVWPREHKSKLQSTINKRKREKINIDKGEYGGYLDDESVHSSQASEPPTPQKKWANQRLAEEQALETAYLETIPLRQRLFSLVSYLCYTLPNGAPIDFSSLYEKFEDTIKHLPLPVFSSFISTSTSALQVTQQISMLQGVLFLFIPSGALKPSKVDPVTAEQGGISPAILERCFLPYPANTIEIQDNAKMSLLLENLLMIVWRYGDKVEAFSDNLVDIVRTGVEARRDKINKKKARGRAKVLSDNELEARDALESSALRLMWLAEAIQESTETGTNNDMMDEDEEGS